MSRLQPKNKRNARLLFVDKDLECDICDEKMIGVVLDCIGNIGTIHICKDCLKELLKNCEKEETI